MKEGPVPTVQNNLEVSRYELYKDGQLAGFLKYRMEGDHMWLLSTEMTAEYEEPALAEKLLLGVLQDVRRRRIGVLPFCPVVRQTMLENPHFLRLIPANPPGHFPLLMDAVELMYDRGAATLSMRSGQQAPGTSRISPQAVIRSVRTRKKEQKRTARFRVQALASAVQEKAGNPAAA